MKSLLKKKGLQQTIKSSIEYNGIALHSGDEVNLIFKPAPADTGIIFRRVDLPSCPEIKADPASVISTRRCTSIGSCQDNTENPPCIYTIEHIMAAVWSLEIDNLIIEVNNSEAPIADGSAVPFIKILEQAGIKRVSAPREVWVIKNPLWVREDEAQIVILPYDGFKVSYTLQYEHPAVGTQYFEFDNNKDSFVNKIAKARTFGFKRELDTLQENGLALGGNLDNAVLIGDENIVNSLRYSNEFVRHKILDIVGDMALNGFVEGHIMSIKSGHSLHVALARKIGQKLGE